MDTAYDAGIGRFTGVDPIADDFAWVSVFNYAENSPIANIDLHGLQKFYAVGARELGQIGNNNQVRLVENKSDEAKVKKYINWANTAKNDLHKSYNIQVCLNLSCEVGMTDDELNIRATLSTIRTAEGHGTPLAYNAQYGNNTFERFDDHPRKKIKAWGSTSTAAGAYQFLVSTWDGHAKSLGLSDFSPANQDRAAIAEMNLEKTATTHLLSGQYEQALKELSVKWSSLPGGVNSGRIT